MRFNNSGKILTFFSIIVALLLSSLLAMGVYNYQVISTKRAMAEKLLEQSKQSEAQLNEQLVALKKEIFLIGEKNKELDNRFNDVKDELELEHGLRDGMKQEIVKLKEELEKERSAKEQLQTKLSEELTTSQNSVAALQAQLEKERQRIQGTEGIAQDVSKNTVEKVTKKEPRVMLIQPKKSVRLGKIVVDPNESRKGLILTVDEINNFVIVNLGEKDGVRLGDVLSVFRDGSYLGDIKVTGLQPNMAAADLVPPFSSLNVQKNDQVVVQQ